MVWWYERGVWKVIKTGMQALDVSQKDGPSEVWDRILLGRRLAQSQQLTKDGDIPSETCQRRF